MTDDSRPGEPTDDAADGPVDLAYLNGMYQRSADPWGIGTGWYERRKRELVLGCLVEPRYRSGFEPGCSSGVLTEALAERTDQLLAADLNEQAVRHAADRVSAYPHVQVQRLLLPDGWPGRADFDLVLLSEIGYFFSPVAWSQLCVKVAGSLAENATVLACHWRHDFAERTVPTAELHAELDRALELPKQSTLLDADFLIDVWSSSPGTLAGREGLTG